MPFFTKKDYEYIKETNNTLAGMLTSYERQKDKDPQDITELDEKTYERILTAEKSLYLVDWLKGKRIKD